MNQTNFASLLSPSSPCFKTGIGCLGKQSVCIVYPGTSCVLRYVCAGLVTLAGTGVTKVIVKSSRVALKRGSLNARDGGVKRAK